MSSPRDLIRSNWSAKSLGLSALASVSQMRCGAGAGVARAGCWRETDAEEADRETLIRDLVEGQYSHPVRIVAFNTTEGWSRDVTKDVADELRRRYVEFGEVSESILEFLDANRR